MVIWINGAARDINSWTLHCAKQIGGGGVGTQVWDASLITGTELSDHYKLCD